MKKSILSILLLASLSLTAEFKIYPSKDANCGINTYTETDCTWRAEMIHNTQPNPNAHYVPVGGDFFQHEYGKAFDFSAGDMLKEFGAHVYDSYRVEDGALVIPKGKDFSFTFGQDANHKDAPGLRFGQQWAKTGLAVLCLVMDIEQAGPTSQWQIIKTRRGGQQRTSPFTVKGSGKQTATIRLGPVTDNHFIEQGIGFTCLAPESEIRVSKMRLVPMMGDVFYRKKFNLDFVPDVAKLSLLAHSLDDYDLFLNGVNVARPMGQPRTVQVENLRQVAKHLKKGENTIAIRLRYGTLHRYIAGHEPPSRLLFELFAYDRTGRKEFVTSDRSWKTSFVAGDGWQEASFDDTAWAKPDVYTKMTYLANGKKIAMGFNPQHTGFLTVDPLGQQYPIFDAEASTARGFMASYPAGLKNAKLDVRIEHDSKDVKENLVLGKVREDNGFVYAEYLVKSKVPGPYRVKWHLTADGLDEKREDELILVGKIDQELFALKDFDREFRKRLELVRMIDATKEHTIGPGFMARSAVYQKGEILKPVVEKINGIEFLSLKGSASLSWMGWQIDTPILGDAYYLEIDVPDVDDRTLDAAVLYSKPVAMDNSYYPLGSSTFVAATGAITTGGVQKNSNGIKTLSMVFHAANKSSTVMVTHPHEVRPAAAVCEIRLYHVKGNLPGMIVPKTNREIMEHHERFTTWQTLAACDNIFEGGMFHPYHYHKDGWRNWYKGIERKIRQLRFQGHNASIEGMLMYDRAHYPSADVCNSLDRGEEFDVPHLMIRMYEKNDITCYLGWEVNRLSLTEKNPGIGVGDAKIQSGEKRGIYVVNRQGKQEQFYASAGVNMLASGVWDDFMVSVKDVYKRYGKMTGVKGLFLAHGFYWQPGFLSLIYPDSSGGSFDDDSIELFEKMTGIQLNTGTTSPDRFEKRYQLLNGKYKEQYYAWRKTVMTQKIGEVRDLLQSGDRKWELALSLNFSHAVGDPKSPFVREDSTQEEQDGYLARRLWEQGESTAFAKEPGMTWFLPLGINPEYKWGNVKRQKQWSKFLTNRGTQKLIGEANAVYSAYMLSEFRVSAEVPDGKWHWKNQSAVCVYQRPAGEAAYLRELQICKEFVPKSLVIAGIDCHPYTGQAEECRRFAKAFYSVPEKVFERTDAITGIDARVADEYVRLYNDTPNVIRGRLNAGCPFVELVYDAKSDARNGMDFEIRPYSMLVCKAEKTNPGFKGTFNSEEPSAVANRAVLQNGFTATVKVDCSAVTSNEVLYTVGPVRLVLRMAGKDKSLARYDDAHGNYLSYPLPDGSCPVLEATIAEKAGRVGIPLGFLKNPGGVHEVTLHYSPVKWAIAVEGHVDEDFPIPAYHVRWQEDAREETHSPRVKAVSFVTPARSDALPADVMRTIMRPIQYWTPDDHNRWVGDVAPAYLDGKLHVFYLVDRRHHGSGEWTGRHQFAHLVTEDLVNWKELPLAVPISEKWQTVGTGTPFLKDGKLAIAFGWHTSRYGQLKGYPLGGSYATSEDGVNFTDSKVMISDAQNPSIYNLPDGRYELVTSYGGSIGIFHSKDLLKWDLFDAKLPFRGDCPSLFDWNGHRYLLQGFKNMAYSPDGTPGSFVDWTNEPDKLYDGLGVPMVTKWKDNRRLYIGWLNHVHGWGGWLVFREVVAYPDGRLGLK